MRHVDSIFTNLLKFIDRRAFKARVARLDGDAYDKSFGSWEHLVALIFAQLSAATSLRGLVTAWNANAHGHYHVGAGPLARSTLSDANSRRPPGVFAETFSLLTGALDRREGAQMLRLIDSTPVPLSQMCDFARWNGRIRGLKMHVVYDPGADRPMRVEITLANVNDVEIGRKTQLEAGATYAFDKAYCHYGWWAQINAAGAFLVTRPKKNARFSVMAARVLAQTQGDGFCVLADDQVALASKGDSQLPIPLRRILVEREDAKTITLLTNDLTRSAVEIAAIYKARWQVELLFRWIKQHLEIRCFIGRSQNAVNLQLIAAMIAFVLLRLAARLHGVTLPALRFAELVAAGLFTRRPIARIDKPPPVNPAKPQPKSSPNQCEFSYV
jgi:putative transposase